MNAMTQTPATVSAFAWVPDFAKGHVRDLRVRWALEEASLPYGTAKLSPGENAGAYRDQQPFGQVPAYRDGEVEMFESGAIVLHIAERSEALMPRDAAGRARVLTWMFCALNTMEIPIGSLADIDIFNAGAAWTKERRPAVEAWARKRLAELALRLGDNDYLDGDRFTAGDLLMTDVLRNAPAALLAEQPKLAAYVERCMARPAFQKALAAQMADFTGSPPPGWN
ncbi:glutathione S-transferase family protein [Caulobacter sp. 1776]|uniref:glutathione S-transferase family protein n=1 Tax=Caulobacter sp. 1776 TaxID=3156420 RepID=UPI00339405AF